MNISITPEENRELKEAAKRIEATLNKKLLQGRVTTAWQARNGAANIVILFSYCDCRSVFHVPLDEYKAVSDSWYDFVLNAMLHEWTVGYFLKNARGD